LVWWKTGRGGWKKRTRDREVVEVSVTSKGTRRRNAEVPGKRLGKF